MATFKRGLCASIVATGVLALTASVAAQEAPDDEEATPPVQPSQAPPAQTPDGRPDVPEPQEEPIAGDPQHDPSPEAANLPDPNVPPPTDAQTWSEGGDAADPNAPVYVTTEPTRYESTERNVLLDDIGFALAVGGGVSGFTDETARATTEDGGGWDVRAVIGTKVPLAAEISYIGSVQAIDALGLDDDALLVGNGMQANVRLNILSNFAVQPFVFGGAAWRRYDVTNTDTNTSDIDDTDNVFEFPAGLGVAFRSGGLLVDVRGEYRATIDNDLMPSLSAVTPDDSASLHRWGANASIGYEF